MGWYTTIKISQVWNVSYSNESLVSCLEAIYELTYKYQTLQKQRFQGHPKRFDSIVSNINSKARMVISDIYNILDPVFENWLESHALLDQEQWATKRMEHIEETGEEDPETVIQMVFGSIANKKIDRKTIETETVGMLSSAIESGNCKYLKNMLDVFKNENIESLEQGNEDSEQQSSIEYYKNINFKEVIYDYFEGSLSRFLSNTESSVLYPIAKEIMTYAMFPIWYSIWGPLGIDKARSNVERASSMIKNLNSLPLPKALANINIIINTCHQTGEMVEYISEHTGEADYYIKNKMQYLSDLSDNSTEIKKWNEDINKLNNINNTLVNA